MTEDKRKRIAVLGATGSMGEYLCEYFASTGAVVFVCARNEEKGASLCGRIKGKYRNADISFVGVEMSSFESVKSFCGKMSEICPDILINAVGIYHLPKKITDDGYEQTFEVNCLSHYLIFSLLAENMAKYGGRIVEVSSLASFFSHPAPDDIQSFRTKSRTKAYANSKRLLSVVSEAFAEKYGNVFRCHPGISATSLFSASKGGFGKLFNAVVVPIMKFIFPSPKKACRSIIAAASGEKAAGVIYSPSVFGIYGKAKCKKCRKRKSDAVLLSALEKTIGIFQNV